MSLMQRAAGKVEPEAGETQAHEGGESPGMEQTEDTTGVDPGEGQGGGEQFKRADVASKVPPDLKDAFDRTVAAGMKFMYAPEMRQKVLEEIQRDAPVPQQLAESTVGLLLTMDGKSQGGIPEQVLYLAGMELLGEAAEILVQAGKPVTQENYDDGLNLMFVLIDKKRGVDPKQTMDSATKAVQGGGETPQDQQAEPAGEPAPTDDWED